VAPLRGRRRAQPCSTTLETQRRWPSRNEAEADGRGGSEGQRMRSRLSRWVLYGGTGSLWRNGPAARHHHHVRISTVDQTWARRRKLLNVQPQAAMSLRSGVPSRGAGNDRERARTAATYPRVPRPGVRPSRRRPRSRDKIGPARALIDSCTCCDTIGKLIGIMNRSSMTSCFI
jgi:hypothetical protein